jgi:hypothetical protein
MRTSRTAADEDSGEDLEEDLVVKVATVAGTTVVVAVGQHREEPVVGKD